MSFILIKLIFVLTFLVTKQCRRITWTSFRKGHQAVDETVCDPSEDGTELHTRSRRRIGKVPGATSYIRGR